MGQATWVTGRSGGWSVAANWTRATLPDAIDDVLLSGPADGAYGIVSGTGASASLTVIGNTVLAGSFTTGVLQVGTSATAGALDLSGGTTLSASSANLLYGPLLASGPNTRLTVTGALTLGATVAATGGAVVQLGSVLLQTGSLVTVD